MEKFGFKLSKADPCLMYRKTKKGICMIEYVEDRMVKIEFMKSKENNAGLFMKNCQAIYLKSMQRN